MAKVKVEVLKAEVDGKKQGEQLTVDEKSAEYLAKIKYVKIVQEAPKPTPKKTSATKKKADSGKSAE